MIDPDKQLSEHFQAGEFVCKCCGRLHPDGVPQQLLTYLEKIRQHFGKPVYLTSGYRCPAHNAAVGGVKGSFHKKGMAADIWVEGVDPQHVYDYADEMIGAGGGVGDYDGFTHIDIRGERKRW